MEISAQGLELVHPDTAYHPSHPTAISIGGEKNGAIQTFGSLNRFLLEL